jgi:cytochrome bd-type quinol oxidase subunit 2
MSSFAYGALTAQRQVQEPSTSTDTGKPGIGTYIDVLAGLVPAEVLALNAALLPVMTKTSTDKTGNSVTTVTEPGALKALFFISIVLSAGLYIMGHTQQQKKSERKKVSALRYWPVLIPALSYVGWTMLQRSTAFDAFAPEMSEAVRELIAATVAVVLSAIAVRIGFKADEEPPPPSS